MNILRTILIVLACLLFLCAAAGWTPGPIAYPVPAGLFCWALSCLLGSPLPWKS
jgi:hypothetical protein